MIRSNFSVILAENNLKITKVAHDTGISRTTLTALAQNDCKGVQFDTVNTLCMYLDITPSQLIDYMPIDIRNIQYFNENTDNQSIPDDILGTVYFDLVKGKYTKYSCNFEVTCDIMHSDASAFSNTVIYMLYVLKSNDSETDEALKVLEHLPRPFLLDLSEHLSNTVINQMLIVPQDERHEFATVWQPLEHPYKDTP